MIHSSTFAILVQAVAALLIFAIGYLALLLSMVTCLGIAISVYKGARLLWSYMMKSAASPHRVPAEVTGNVRLAPRNVAIMSHHIAIARRSGL